MTLKFSGSIHYANGDPVPDVVVRIYDRDAEGKTDDDLTVISGLSDEQGKFNLTYEPMRYLDYQPIDIGGTPQEPFDTATPDLRLPELGDFYLPYLQFNYTFYGRDRQHTTPLGIFQKSFYLPENPPIEFLPSTHGFRFTNSFAGYFLPFSTPAFMGASKVTSKYGLCGGMCAAAYDFALAGKAIPETAEVPHQGTRLQRYLFKRQIDSLGGLGQQAIKVAQWTSLPDDTPLGTEARTAKEFNSIQKKLDDKNPVMLALIYVRTSSLLELSRVIFNNHQVLAYSYLMDPSSEIKIRVYDPNLPGRDDVVIHSQPVLLGEMSTPSSPQAITGLKSTQAVGGVFYRDVRGFFCLPYMPVRPPKKL